MMRQALHILKKDVRYLWPEIGVILLLAVWQVTKEGFGFWSRDTYAVGLHEILDLLLPIAAAFVIARLIHADAIPGDKQFWVTRPYRWSSLLTAKLGFVLVFVSLPIFLVRLIALVVMGFPPAWSIGVLLWSHLLIVLGFGLPVVALAAMTSRGYSFVLSALGLAALLLYLQDDLVAWGARWPVTVAWVRNALVLIAVVAVTCAILYVQYKDRRTTLSRVLTVVMLALGAAGYWALPFSFGMALQSKISGSGDFGAHVELGHVPPIESGRQVLMLPIGITGVQKGQRVQLDAFKVRLVAADGRSWSSGWTGVDPAEDETAVFHQDVLVDAQFFEAERSNLLTLRASIYATVFDSPQTETLPSEERHVKVLDGLQCIGLRELWAPAPKRAFTLWGMDCRAAIAWPNAIVRGAIDDSEKQPAFRKIEAGAFGLQLSYSPFPLDGMSLHTTQTLQLYLQMLPEGDSARPVLRVTAQKPIAHFRREVELKDILLGSVLK
jgi:hypothetical protein